MTSTGLIHNPISSSKLIATFALNPFPGTTCIAQCIFKMGLSSELVIVTSVLQMYGLFDKLGCAQSIFDETPHRDVVLWNVLIALYVQRNYAQEALSVLSSMVNENVKLNEVTAVSILSACSYLGTTNEGKQIHGFVLRNLVSLDVFVHNALIEMYAECGYLFDAQKVFQKMPMRNVVSWTTMINGYSDHCFPDEALALFEEMENENVRPDEITMLGVISICSKPGSLKLATWIDHYVEKKGFKDSVLLTNALIDMHSKCGDIGRACQIFNEIAEKTIVSWTTIIKGLAMRALIDMHSKCGDIGRACQIFNEIAEKTIVSWTTIIKGLAMHGHGIAALTRFYQMQREGFKPDNILFLSILPACSHAGWVDEGGKFFQSLIEDYKMKPQMEHYGCMVDLLCRAGLVSEALKFVEGMPINPDVIIWRTLLGACTTQGETDLASQIRNRLLELEPQHSGNYVLLSNM